jgi:hypothetical protein
MPNRCDCCGSRMRSDRRSPTCRACDMVCTCGNPKDQRAASCLSCGMRTKALLQWKEQPAAIRGGILEAGKRRRMRYENLTWESFGETKPDGRRFARYWDDKEQHRIEMRSRWVWKQQYGSIPDGWQIHHVNHDCTDDRLRNLSLAAAFGHRSYHSRQPANLAQLARARESGARKREAQKASSPPTDTTSASIHLQLEWPAQTSPGRGGESGSQ